MFFVLQSYTPSDGKVMITLSLFLFSGNSIELFAFLFCDVFCYIVSFLESDFRLGDFSDLG